MATVSVRFLGSGDAFGSGGRLQACILLESDAGRYLIDCGATSLSAMKRFDIDPSSIDAVVISHLHGDHFGGLPFLILDGQFSRRTRPLVIAGPPGIEERLHQTMEVLFPGSSQTRQKYRISVTELQENVETMLGALSVTPFLVLHVSGAPAYALRVSFGGKIVAYSGDTEWTGTIVDAADGADLFICEAYHFDKRVKFHLDYATLMAHRGELRCQRLIFTHMSSDMLSHTDEIDVECAKDGLLIEL